MNIQQLSIFVENEPGRLAEITKTLADAKVDIRAISVADTCDFGILRLIVNDPDLAVKVLSDAGVTATPTSVLAIAIDDHPGALASAMTALAEKDITVEYLYAFISRELGKAYVILRVDKQQEAEDVLNSIGMSMPEAEQIHGM